MVSKNDALGRSVTSVFNSSAVHYAPEDKITIAEKRHYISMAKDLGYGDKTISRIKKARTTSECENALRRARKGDRK